MPLRIATVLSCLFVSQLLFAQSSYEKAFQNFDIADSLSEHSEKFDRVHDLLDQARTSFSAMDSMKMVFQCDFLKVKALFTAGELEACISISKEAQEIITDGPHDTLRSYHQYYRGMSHFNARQYVQAGEELSKLEAIMQTPVEDQKFRIESKRYFAMTQTFLQQYDEVAAGYLDAMELLGQLPDSKYKVETSIKVLDKLATNYMQIGATDKGFSALQEALSLNSKFEEFYSPATEALILNTYGATYISLGFRAKAREYFLQSLELNNEDFNVWNNLAITYKHEQNYEEAVSIYKELLGRDLNQRQFALIRNNLGSAYVEMGEYQKALEYLNEAEQMNRQLNRRSSLIITLALMGLSYHNTNQWDKAESRYHEARELIGSNSPEISFMSSQNFWSMKDTAQAINYAKKAVFKSDSTFNSRTVSASHFRQTMEGQRWLIELYDHLSHDQPEVHRQEIVELCRKAHQYLTSFKDAYHGPVLEITDESLFLYEQGIRNSMLLANKAGSTEPISTAFLFSEWSKFQALGAELQIKNEQSKYNLPTEILDLAADLKSKENVLKSQIENSAKDTARTAFYSKQLFMNRKSQDSLLNIIRTNYPRYNQLRYGNKVLSAKEIQGKLSPHEAFIEYFQGDTTSYVFTVTKSNLQVQPIELDTDTLIAHFRDYFKPETFSNDITSLNEISHHIYRSYVAPALTPLDPSVTELIVVPDGSLAYIPFDILLTENAPEAQDWSYLIHQYQIHYAYSASLYFNEFSSLSTNNEYLAFAPEYPESPEDTLFNSRLGRFRNQVTPLKHNKAEVDFIGTQFQGLGFFGKAANEENFKEHIGQYGVLHLAMHAVLDDEDPMNSKLVFTHSEDTLEDDVLYAFEIYNMQIPSQLTVLSACETGYGKLAKGEGALSLARAFSYAGSPSVIMSHWPVDDQTTAQLMQHLYESLADGKPKSEALRAAKLEFLKTAHPAQQHPFFWGSFVVMGDDTPISLKKKHEPIYYVIASLLILAMITFWVVRRRKSLAV
ncbi:MAG: CHAT domain-containing protein [Cytophagales bacterium]|nr:CHAT domain-containing protein [Cytophagales bacterium]